MGGVATPVVISGQSELFRDNQSYSGTIWAKAGFRDPSGTQVRNSGLSRNLEHSNLKCLTDLNLNIIVGVSHSCMSE